MKTSLITIALSLFAFLSHAQSDHNGYPQLKAKGVKANYRIGNDWIIGNWIISPNLKCDSLLIPLRAEKEMFSFFTDCDSISFELKPEETTFFYVMLPDKEPAFTAVKGIKPMEYPLEFDNTALNAELKFWYEGNNGNEYLNRLRSRYPLDSLIQNAKNDTEKAVKILNWVHNQWQHNGNNTPKKNDAISILEEVKTGKNFRCVEYGIVTTACLNAVGLKARTLSLKTKDVEITRYGAGHVLLEVYLNDLDKWVLLDGQWDAMPVLNNLPLNAVEFQKAIVENYNDLEIRSISGTNKRHYVNWIYPYLYYFSYSFDNREGVDRREKVQDKIALMLVPKGAKNPTIFQINSKINYCVYTHSLCDFYRKP